MFLNANQNLKSGPKIGSEIGKATTKSVALTLLLTPLLGTHVGAQGVPLSSLVPFSSSRSASVVVTVNPACAVATQQNSVTIAALLPAAPVSGVNSPAARIDFFCNTLNALVSVSTTGRLTQSVATVPSGRESTKFTTGLDFTARGELVDYQSSASSSSFLISNLAAVGPTNRRVSDGTGTRRRSVFLQASDINSGGLIPVAGSYSGVICVGVDPAGVIAVPTCALASSSNPSFATGPEQ